ncbi:MAG: TlyA family RNA methyltransferase, partial [Schwartzia sp.]|nr:TlyA family RNA methyltransferase [Schwartzia sp. (in: firmicutes)]
MAKERLDVLLVERNLAESRERAKITIMEGLVLVNGQKVDKAGTMVKPDAEIRILGNTLPYVSRGGLKLEKALKTFPITLEGKVMADIGASTGGFTDCSLQNGASKVYAIDVGYGQLAWKLRQDARVINMERTNVRYVTKEDVGDLRKLMNSIKNLNKKDFTFCVGSCYTLFENNMLRGLQELYKKKEE